MEIKKVYSELNDLKNECVVIPDYDSDDLILFKNHMWNKIMKVMKEIDEEK
jgi:hypothetical protein